MFGPSREATECTGPWRRKLESHLTGPDYNEPDGREHTGAVRADGGAGRGGTEASGAETAGLSV